MKVELKPHVAMSVSSRKIVEYDEQLIIADGMTVGKLGNAPTSRIAWFGRQPIALRKQVESEVAEMVGRDVSNDRIAPELPTELFDEDDDEDDDIDD